MQRWARAYRDNNYHAAIDTNNGTEAQNRLFKYSFLPRRKHNATLSNTVSIIVENFLPTRRQQYLLQNFQQSSLYRPYHSYIPSYLHDRPRSIIIHCLDRRTNSAKIIAETYMILTVTKEYLRLKKHLEPSIGLILAKAAQKKCLLALVKIGSDTTYHANTFLLSLLTDQLGNGTTSLNLTCRVHIFPLTPRHSMTTFNHLQTTM